jgi:hypothetical protein
MYSSHSCPGLISPLQLVGHCPQRTSSNHPQKEGGKYQALCDKYVTHGEMHSLFPSLSMSINHQQQKGRDMVLKDHIGETLVLEKRSPTNVH